MSKWAACALLLALAGPAVGYSGISPSDVLSADPYDYRARQGMARTSRSSGDWASAYYQAAWLAWFAPKQFADSPEGARLLRDRRARDQAAWEGSGGAAIAALAIETSESITSTCLNGAVVTQSGRLRDEVGNAIARAEQMDGRLDHPDPVARAALARLYLLLDDCLVLDAAPESRRARLKMLQKASSLASAVVDWLPKSPGAHLTLATARARLASLENRAEFWDMALEECEMAQALDPADPALSDMIWTLHLRAGHWAEAKRWENGGPEVKGRRKPKGK
jgi:hypothetical protein